jgi:hypothetical protein
MSYRLKQDPETLTKARSILASPTLVGSEAWTLSEDEVVRRAEIVMNSFAGNGAAIRLAARPVATAILESPVGRRLASLAVVKEPGPPDELEQLIECAA